MAPLDGGAQGLVAGKRGPTASREEVEAVAETGEHLLHAEHPGAHRCQLDRQGQTVKSAAEVGDHGGVAFGEVESPGCRRGPFAEEDGRLVEAKLGQRL